MLTQYIRDRKNRPIGAVVALDRNKIGWCLIHPLDRREINSKEKIKEYAIARAESRPKNGFHKGVPHTVKKHLEGMMDRAEKYFKQGVALSLTHNEAQVLADYLSKVCFITERDKVLSRLYLRLMTKQNKLKNNQKIKAAVLESGAISIQTETEK